jgi:cell filamentation protein
LTGITDVHRRVVAANFLIGLSADEFAAGAAVIVGDVNYIHPFREGNGRTQLQYLKQLALRAGHLIDLAKLDPTVWIEASKASHEANYDRMAEAIRITISDPAEN